MPISDDDDVVDHRHWLAEHRYRGALQVQDGVPIAQVAQQAGASRQSVYAWIRRYEAGRLGALADRSRRPHSSPARLPTQTEALICQLRQAYPRRGASNCP